MQPRKRYLEDRIVFCANCDCNRLLHSSSAGLVCTSCSSRNWMYLPNARPRATAMAAVSGVLMKVVEKLSSSRLVPIMD
jgi:hypothetical protein